jgi:tetratricopeptide (TPR) repeat protein
MAHAISGVTKHAMKGTEAMSQMSQSEDVSHAEMLRRRTAQTLEEITPSISKSDAAGAIARGKMYELVGFFSAAASAYNEALVYESGSHEALARLAITELKAGRTAQGLKTATDLAARAPEFEVSELAGIQTVSSMTILGDALLLSNRVNDAQVAYEQARRINADDGYASVRLAQLRLMEGDVDGAVELRPAFASDPKFGSLATSLNLAKTSPSLVPSISEATIVADIKRFLPGRPVSIDKEIRLADPVVGDDRWCTR